VEQYAVSYTVLRYNALKSLAAHILTLIPSTP
jgi:hypothetical protein